MTTLSEVSQLFFAAFFFLFFFQRQQIISGEYEPTDAESEFTVYDVDDDDEDDDDKAEDDSAAKAKTKAVEGGDSKAVDGIDGDETADQAAKLAVSFFFGV